MSRAMPQDGGEWVTSDVYAQFILVGRTYLAVRHIQWFKVQVDEETGTPALVVSTGSTRHVEEGTTLNQFIERLSGESG